MLDGLRAFARTWVGKIIGAFLIVGLAGFGISNVLLDLGSNKVATVGEQDITVRSFQREYQNRINQVSQQFGRILTNEEALAFGIPSVVLSQLGAEAALNQMGQNMEIGVSDARLSTMLREDPSFFGVLGAFEPQNFQRVLQSAGYTEEEYFNLQRNAARRQQVAQGLFIGSPTPDAAVELINRYSGDRRVVEYFTLNPVSMMLDVPVPTDAELTEYLEANQADFRTRETRTVDLVALTVPSLAATITISDADVEAEYERTRAQRTTPERRTIVQVPLNAELQAAFEEARAANIPFPDVVASTGVSPSNVGTLAQSEITDSALATAAFSLETGEFTLIPGIGGQRAIAVTNIEPGGEAPLDEVRDDIRQSLATAAAREDYIDILDQIEELRAALQPLATIAERFNLQLVEVPLTQAGAELSAVPDLPAEQRQPVVNAVFAATPEGLPPTVTISANSHVWFDLKSIEEARDQTLEEAREALTTAWTEARTRELLNAAGADALAQVEGGTPLADVALGLNQFPELSQPLSRTGDGTTTFSAAAARDIFEGAEGSVGLTTTGDGDLMLYQVVEVVPPEGDITEDPNGLIAETRQNTLYSDFMGGLRESMGMQINQQTLSQLLAPDATAN